MERLRFQEEEAERQADYNKVAELRISVFRSTKRNCKKFKMSSTANPTAFYKKKWDENLIAHIVSKWTGIPVTNDVESEAQRLLHLEKDIEKRVVGQETWPSPPSARAIRRSRSGLSDPCRPMGAFLFLGPTGVGKN